MTSSYNLVDEPWIPCITLDGQYLELGLRDTLARASDLREIRDNSPLVTAALYRLLLAVLHRVLDPKDEDEWAELRAARAFDAEQLGDYWQAWNHRFDLYHPERPFYQAGGYSEGEVSSIARLAMEFSCQNNATLFDHTIDESPPILTHADAARLIVASQCYCFSCKLQGGYGSASPLFTAALFLVRGHTLWETLSLNLLWSRQRPSDPIDDLPVWEIDEEPEPSHDSTESLIRFLTWQARRIRIVPPSPSEKGPSCVYYGVGAQWAKQAPPFEDPYTMIRRTDDGLKPYRLRLKRALWRDSSTLMGASAGDKQPQVFEQLASLQDTAAMYGVDVIGLATSKSSKVDLWRHEQFPLPTRYLKDEALVGDLQHALNYAEEAGKALWAAIRNLATNLLVPLDELDRKPDRDMVSQLAGSLSCEGHFWAALEAAFYRMFIALAEEPEHADEAIAEWRKTILQTARSVFGLSARGHEESARGLRAIAKAQRKLNADLNRVLEFEREEVNTHA